MTSKRFFPKSDAISDLKLHKRVDTRDNWMQNQITKAKVRNIHTQKTEFNKSKRKIVGFVRYNVKLWAAIRFV